MTKYPRVKKGYVVGVYEEVIDYGKPWSRADLILVKVNEGANKARSEYANYELLPYTEIIARRHKEADLFLFEGEERSTIDIQYVLDRRKWVSDMQEMIKNNPGGKVRIYSGQWGAWWRANACGYTQSIKEAGIYDIEEAWKCVSHCGLEKQISLHLLIIEQEVKTSVATDDAILTNPD